MTDLSALRCNWTAWIVLWKILKSVEVNGINAEKVQEAIWISKLTLHSNAAPQQSNHGPQDRPGFSVKAMAITLLAVFDSKSR